MRRQFFIGDRIQLYTNPATHTDVRRPEVNFRRVVDQHPLLTRRRRYPNCDMPVVVVVVGKHSKDFFADEEGGFAVR